MDEASTTGEAGARTPWWQLGNRAGGIVVAVIVVAGLAAFGLIRWATAPSLCDVLAARPGDMTSVSWDNGVTSGRASWHTVLSDGVQHGDEPTRQAMAEAVADDGSGFAAILDRIPAEERPAFQRLRALALDPDAGRAMADDPATEQDVRVLHARKSAAACEWF